MSRQIRNEPHAATIGLYHFGFWQPVRVKLLATCAGVVAAFDVDGRLQLLDEGAGGWLIEDGDIINAGEGGEDFGALLLRHQGATWAFQAARAFVAVQAKNQEIAQRAGILQVANMAEVQQVEAAIGENGLFACLLPASDDLRQFIMRENLGKYLYCVHKIALNSSSGVLLAQPRRRTTSAAAAFAR